VDDIQKTALAARLVTLNACSSGLQGDRNAGDEFDGFSRALLMSGASSTILTLWNVDQVTSVDFMHRLYHRWLGADRQIPLWKSIHEAQHDFIASDDPKLRHPYHWAPFALRGDWI
jgi:CHAT domain-containing protein